MPHGRLSRKDCLALQSDSRFLLLSTWNDKREKGVFPGKFLEYMLLEKPIIAVVSGNLGESEVAQVMKETRLGFCFEEVDGKAGEEKLFAYLCQDWNRCRKGLPPDFHPKKDVIRQYDWEYLIEKFEELV